MHINDWLISAAPHGETILRSWLLAQAFYDAHDDGELIDPLVVERLLAAPLPAAFQTAWETTYKGNEEAAWESLNRFSLGRSKRFLVTFSSYKYDGLALIITDVPDKEAAYRKAATIWSEDDRETWRYTRLTHNEGEADVLLPDGYSEADAIEAYDMLDGPRRLLEVHASQLAYNRNLPEAVAW